MTRKQKEAVVRTAADLHGKTGLCLGGGGAMGFAHIGVIDAFENAGFVPEVISGTSMGSIIGVFYAAGFKTKEILEITKKEKMYSLPNVIHVNIHNASGFANHDRLKKIIHKYIPHNSFDKLQKKFYTNTVDLRRNKTVIVCSGDNLAEYVTASASLPVVFSCGTIDGVEYIDGGTKNNFPIEPLIEEKCDTIIGSHVLNFTPGVEPITKKNIAWYCYSIMDKTMNEERLAKCTHTIYVSSPNPEKYNIFSFDKYMELYNIGLRAGQDYISKLSQKDNPIQ